MEDLHKRILPTTDDEAMYELLCYQDRDGTGFPSYKLSNHGLSAGEFKDCLGPRRDVVMRQFPALAILLRHLTSTPEPCVMSDKAFPCREAIPGSSRPRSILGEDGTLVFHPVAVGQHEATKCWPRKVNREVRLLLEQLSQHGLILLCVGAYEDYLDGVWSISGATTYFQCELQSSQLHFSPNNRIRNHFRRRVLFDQGQQVRPPTCSNEGIGNMRRRILV